MFDAFDSCLKIVYLLPMLFMQQKHDYAISQNGRPKSKNKVFIYKLVLTKTSSNWLGSKTLFLSSATSSSSSLDTKNPSMEALNRFDHHPSNLGPILSNLVCQTYLTDSVTYLFILANVFVISTPTLMAFTGVKSWFQILHSECPLCNKHNLYFPPKKLYPEFLRNWQDSIEVL